MGFQRLYFWPIFVLLRIEAEAVPPDACFANFRWDDCGKSPVPVMYYWKPGSRCEVGLWRGCLPNFNMFQDEYECVTTCIFTARAIPEDYHSMNDNLVEADIETTTEAVTEIDNTTDVTSGDITTVADAASTGGTTIADTNAGGNNTNPTAAGDKATTGAGGGGGGEAATTAAPAA